METEHAAPLQRVPKMEIKSIEFESQLVIIKNNQRITITPFLTNEHGNIKFGIDAPKGLVLRNLRPDAKI